MMPLRPSGTSAARYIGKTTSPIIMPMLNPYCRFQSLSYQDVASIHSNSFG